MNAAIALLPEASPLVGHMAGHLLLMNVAAPLLAALMPALRRPFASVLPLATLGQIVLLWSWHSPAAMAAAMDDPWLHLAMQASLLLAALAFWSAVLAQRASGIGHGLMALLLTSKLFCLLGVLLTFAPRPLYPAILHHGGTGLAADALADQQAAGLMMLVACPASYVLAAIALAWRWIAARERQERPAIARPPP
ncbi:MAG: cytochrome c oxidase assembly protein [Alphaproteobacteria bacterium]